MTEEYEQRMNRRTAIKSVTLGMLAGLSAVVGCSSKADINQYSAEESEESLKERIITGIPISSSYSFKSHSALNRLSIMIQSGKRYTLCYIQGNDCDSREVSANYNRAVAIVEAFKNEHKELTITGEKGPNHIKIDSIEGKLGEDSFQINFGEK
ncbi:MAG: hypothetical protein WC867_08410 [Candidatus Pacearchaeota archaeon]|jgi:hypothetical protein